MLPGDGPVDAPLQACDHCGNTLRCKECDEWDGFCVVQGFTSTPCIDLRLELECEQCIRMRIRTHQPPPTTRLRWLLGCDLW